MDKHVLDYFHEYSEGGSRGNFHHVIALHAEEDPIWDELSLLAPTLPRGWFELGRLSTEDRVEFVQAYWGSKLPYQAEGEAAVQKFFDGLDDIGIFITQEKPDLPYHVQMVYSLANNGGFYWGHPPVHEEVWNKISAHFSEVIFPEDYLAFLALHDGFGKQADTGMIPSNALIGIYKDFQRFLEEGEPLLTPDHEAINPYSLIPFYESFGLHCYQCFWTDWYPGNEMGNVYYSGIERTLALKEIAAGSEQLAFSTFLDWLAFYLERID